VLFACDERSFSQCLASYWLLFSKLPLDGEIVFTARALGTCLGD
jgi:hypothetical protein